MITEIKADYKQGMPISQIDRKYYVANIYAHLPKDLRRNSTEFHNQLCIDYENGSSIKDLQEKYNITREYVYVLLKKYGIEIRKVRKVE